jgi:SAM-dependent methyltransferase
MLLSASAASILAEQEFSAPTLVRHMRGILQISELAVTSLDAAAREADAVFWTEGEHYARVLERLWWRWGLTPDQGLRSFLWFCLDHLKAQHHLKSYGQYPARSSAVITDQIYLNEKLMREHYLSGIWLSQFFWPNHYRLFRFYADEFLPRISSSAKIIEIGVGHGLLFGRALESKPGARGVGLDLSPYALEWTRNLLDELCILEPRYQLKLADIQAEGLPPEIRADAVVIGEVIEHLERPRIVLERIRDALEPGGYCYLTTAINAGAGDHIYLFTRPEEVRNLLREYFEVTAEIVLPLRQLPTRELEEGKIPINYGAILTPSN